MTKCRKIVPIINGTLSTTLYIMQALEKMNEQHLPLRKTAVEFKNDP